MEREEFIRGGGCDPTSIRAWYGRRGIACYLADGFLTVQFFFTDPIVP